MSARQTIARRILAAAGALGLAGAVVAGTAHPVEETSASWTNFEYGQASANAAWPVGWAGVQAVRIYTPKYQHDHGYDTIYRSQAKNFGVSTGAGTSDVSLRQSTISGGTAGANGVQTDGSGDYTLESGGYPGATGSAARVPMSSLSCSYVAPNYAALPNGSTGSCGAVGGDMSAATHSLNSFGFQIDERGGAGNSYINAFGIQTGVKCGTNSATVTALAGQVDVSGTNKFLVVNDGRPTYYSGNYTTIWKTSNGTSNTALSGNFDTYNVAGVIEGVRYRPLVRTITQQNPPYALSEIGFYLDTYDGTFGARVQASKFYFSLSRSECGVRNVQPGATTTTAPDRADPSPNLGILTNTTFPTNDTAFSDFQGATTLAEPVPEGRVAQALRAAPRESAAVSTTSPVETSTGVDTTTSAPPTTGAGSTTASSSAASTEATRESTSAVRTSEGTTQPSTEVSSSSTQAPAPSSSAAPAIPAEPGKLPSGAKKCGTVATGEGTEANAVIAAGTECDTSARRDATDALAAYIADGTQDARWKVFASDDATRDGWRWAAIDQETGQIVYVL